jgi:hypothetical protein
MRKWLLWGLLLAAVLWLVLSLERYTTVEHRPSDAHYYAAAATLLEKRDITSRRVYSAAELGTLPDTRTLLIFDANRAQLSDTHIENLHQWVRDGGRLVLAARLIDYFHDFDEQEEIDESRYQNEDNAFYSADFYRKHDPLAYSFGVTGWHNDYHGNLSRQPAMGLTREAALAATSELFLEVCLQGVDENDVLRCQEQMCGDPDAVSAYAVHEDGDDTWRFDLDPHADLLHYDFYTWDGDEDPADYPETPVTDTRLEVAAGNVNGDQLLYLSYGDGEVWVLSDLAIFENARLYHLEHAWLLSRLAEDVDAAWWIESVTMPPLLEWLWRNAWPVLVAFALLVVLFIWQRVPRRGVILEDRNTQATDFLQHLRAASRFLWRAHQRQATLHPLRRQVSRLLARHKKQQETESDADIAARISGMDRAEIRFALSGETDNDDELFQIVTTLQELRSRL